MARPPPRTHVKVIVRFKARPRQGGQRPRSAGAAARVVRAISSSSTAWRRPCPPRSSPPFAGTPSSRRSRSTDSIHAFDGATAAGDLEYDNAWGVERIGTVAGPPGRDQGRRRQGRDHRHRPRLRPRRPAERRSGVHRHLQGRLRLRQRRRRPDGRQRPRHPRRRDPGGREERLPRRRRGAAGRPVRAQGARRVRLGRVQRPDRGPRLGRGPRHRRRQHEPRRPRARRPRCRTPSRLPTTRGSRSSPPRATPSRSRTSSTAARWPIRRPTTRSSR